MNNKTINKLVTIICYSLTIITFDPLIKTASSETKFNNRTDGFNSAYDTCQSFTHLTTKNKCSNLVKSSNYLDSNAVSICVGRFSVSGSTIARPTTVDCFQAIIDRVYQPRDVENCSKNTSTRKIIKCLSTNGSKVESNDDN